MPFKIHAGGGGRPANAEELFESLRRRSPKIKHLWSHQADVLRAYDQKKNNRDVAIELPTGAGKTLVALLIAEYRRQTYNERVAYLCPTRQLAAQVHTQAREYGIDTTLLTGPQNDYPQHEWSAYKTAAATAITTYSALFNTNPRINDAQTIILDDAHASEPFIAGLWSLEIQKQEAPELFGSILNLVSTALPGEFTADINQDRETDSIELVPPSAIPIPELRRVLDEGIPTGSNARYPWSLLRDHLHACNLYVSRGSLLLRPPIPPTSSHPPFSAAKQRIYMSATLGSGGDLDRITGVRPIDRIPAPGSWQNRTTGRRLFLLPQLALGERESLAIATEAARSIERSLVLSPTHRGIEPVTAALQNAGIRVLTAQDIEHSTDTFTTANKAALALTRYDGLDLPDDACRLLILAGFPVGSDLQEKFLWSRLGATAVFRDRVLTRFAQGVGRCTRSEMDYAVIILLGQRLTDFIARQEHRALLNPELQAELSCGIDNSQETSPDHFRELQATFLAQGPEWAKVDAEISRDREQTTRAPDESAAILAATAGREVSYTESMWARQFEAAIEHAKSIADSLGGEGTRSYRGWWHFLAAEAALALHRETGKPKWAAIANEHLLSASYCCPAVSWFAHAARAAGAVAAPGSVEPDELTATAAENIGKKLANLGLSGQKFERGMAAASADIRATEHTAFHRGLKALGELLGFVSDLPRENAAPDCIWSIGSDLVIVHEAKSDQSPGNAIGVNDARQAASHETWVHERYNLTRSAKVVSVIESPRGRIEADARTFAGDVKHWPPSEAAALMDVQINALRTLRASVADPEDESSIEAIRQKLVATKTTPHEIVARLSNRRLRDLPT
ncbi:MAG: DEAD/DEAH box helicase [Terriglobales bacterium]